MPGVENCFLNAPGSKHLKGKWGLNNSITIGTLRSWPYTSSPVFERFPLHLGSTVFHTCRICVVGSTVHYEERAYLDDWGAYIGSQETFSRYCSSFSVWNTRGNIFSLSFPCFSSSNMTQPLHSALNGSCKAAQGRTYYNTSHVNESLDQRERTWERSNALTILSAVFSWFLFYTRSTAKVVSKSSI